VTLRDPEVATICGAVHLCLFGSHSGYCCLPTNFAINTIAYTLTLANSEANTASKIIGHVMELFHLVSALAQSFLCGNALNHLHLVTQSIRTVVYCGKDILRGLYHG